MITIYEHTIKHICGGDFKERSFKEVDLSIFDKTLPLNIYIATWQNSRKRSDVAIGLIFEQNGETIYYDRRYELKNRQIYTKYLVPSIGFICAMFKLEKLGFAKVNFYNSVINKTKFKTSTFNEQYCIYNMLEKALRKDSPLKPIVEIFKPTTDEQIELYDTAIEVASFDDIFAEELRSGKKRKAHERLKEDIL